LQVALNLCPIERVTRASLNPIDDVVFAEPAVADDVDFLNQSRLRLLGTHTTGDEQRGNANGDAQNSEPNDAIRVHK
jgi:hypothetical protein